MKRLRVLLAAGCVLLGLAGTSQANTIWTLQNVHFDDGATATGSFTVNTALTTILNWDITVAGSLDPIPNGNHHYKSGVSGETYTYFTPASWVTFANWSISPNAYLDLQWASPLTNAGGVINLLAGDPSNAPWKGTFDCPGCGVMDSQGYLVGTTEGAPVPEPAMFLLVGTGVAGLIRRRRQTIA